MRKYCLSTSTVALKFCEWVKVVTDVNIPNSKYQVKLHRFSSFSAACAASITHKKHFFRLYQQNKCFVSKAKLRQASNCYKRVLQAAKLPYTNKTKMPFTSRKRGSCKCWRIAKSILNKGKSAIPPLFNGPEALFSAFSALDKAKMFPEIFPKNSNLDNSVISLPAFTSRTNLNWHCTFLIPQAC